MCRSRRELSNAYFLAKFGFDTAENVQNATGSWRGPDDRDRRGIGTRKAPALGAAALPFAFSQRRNSRSSNNNNGAGLSGEDFHDILTFNYFQNMAFALVREEVKLRGLR